MKFYNAFGIKPTNSFTSAGSDYYVPNITTDKQKAFALKAFEKSYNKTKEELEQIYTYFEESIQKEYENNIVNLMHLFFATYSYDLEISKKNDLKIAVQYFLCKYVVYDKKKDVVGVKLGVNDTLFINSGIKVALPTVLDKFTAPNPSRTANDLKLLGIGVAGLYVNKSGKGNAGFDVRACLVDEDYTGYVHLSMAYTKQLVDEGQNIVFCGDKLTQMMLIPIFHDEYIEADEDEYNKIMENSQRGDGGFGSTDIKH